MSKEDAQAPRLPNKAHQIPTDKVDPFQGVLNLLAEHGYRATRIRLAN